MKVSFIWLNEYSYNLQKLLKVPNACTHTCAKTSTPLVNCVVNDALVHCCSQVCSKRCYHFSWIMILTVWTPIINQRNYEAGKFNVCSWVYLPTAMETKLVHVTFFCLHFLPDLRQIWTFKFPKVVQQHT